MEYHRFPPTKGDRMQAFRKPILAAASAVGLTLASALALALAAATAQADTPPARAIQASQLGPWTVGVNNLPAVQPVSQSGTWTVGGSIAISNFPSVQAVSQSGIWTAARSWTLASSTDSVNVGNFPATQPISATALPLPAGASTSALQTTGNTALSALNTKTPALGQAASAASSPVVIASDQTSLPVTVGNLPAVQAVSQNGAWSVGRTWALSSADTVSVANFPATQAVSAAALPLPAGASTAANQATGNASLSSIDTKTPALQAGQVPVVATGSVSVTNLPATQAISAAALPLPSGASTSALQTSGNASLASLDAKTPALQGGSVPVAITNFPATQAVSAAALPLPTGASTAANQTTGNASLASMDGKLPAQVNGQVPVIAQRSWLLNASGDSVLVLQTHGGMPTYSASTINNFAPAASPQDICTLSGSATKTIRVTKISFSATQTTGGYENVFLLRRSTLDTGGTSTTMVAMPYDSADAAPTAVGRYYTANPTTGTLVGVIRAIRTYMAATGSTSGTSGDGSVAFEFNVPPARPLVLRGATQMIALNLGGVAISGGSVQCFFEWTEE